MREKESKSSVWSLVFMILISCISQVLTIMKSSLVAGNFGATEVMDAYNFANSIFSLVFGIAAAGIPTIILPAYVKKQDRKGIDAFITCIYGALLIFIILVMIFRFQIVYTFTNRSELFVEIACNVMLILAFCQFLSSISNITVAYFQAENRFNTPKIISLFSQLVVLAFLVIRNPTNIIEYAWIMGIGVVFTFLIDLIVACRFGWRYRPNLNWRNDELKGMLRIFVPTLMSSGAYQITLFTDSLIASNLAAGKLTILNYANTIVGMVNSLIIANILTFIYPKLIKKLSAGKEQPYFWKQTVAFHAVIWLLFVGIIAVGREGIALLFQRGLFDSEATKQVYFGVVLYASGLQFNVIRDMLYRYFYCLGNTKIPAQNSIIVSVSNVVFSVLLAQFMGFYGIILGTVLSTVISLSTILIRFHKHEKLDKCFGITCFRFFKNMAAGILTIAVVLLTKYFLPIDNNIVAILIFGMESVLIYLGILLLINKRAVLALKE